MEILFLFVGLAFVAVGVAIVLSEVRARHGAAAVPGEVIGFSTGKGTASGAPSYYAVAGYVGLDGRRRYVEGSVGSSVPLSAVGDAVTVLVHPDDAEKAAVKSSGTYLIGAALAAMGLVSCIVFFATFRTTTFSIASAAGVVTWTAWKLRGSLREKPVSLQAWREYKDKVLRHRVFTEETKGEIPWADPQVLQTAVAAQRKTNRLAVPFLFVAGTGLVILGAHLYRTTEVFLAKAVRAQGIVVEMAANHSSDGNTWAPVVEFSHAGNRYRFKDSVSSNPPSYRTGDRVAVLFDPDHPRDARIDRGRWNRLVPILVAGSGALFSLLGFWVLKRRSAERPC
jgi:Protein of unknown function (DUF3592)